MVSIQDSLGRRHGQSAEGQLLSPSCGPTLHDLPEAEDPGSRFVARDAALMTMLVCSAR